MQRLLQRNRARLFASRWTRSSSLGRTAAGVRLLRCAAQDKVAGLAIIGSEEAAAVDANADSSLREEEPEIIDDAD